MIGKSFSWKWSSLYGKRAACPNKSIEKPQAAASWSQAAQVRGNVLNIPFSCLSLLVIGPLFCDSEKNESTLSIKCPSTVNKHGFKLKNRLRIDQFTFTKSSVHHGIYDWIDTRVEPGCITSRHMYSRVNWSLKFFENPNYSENQNFTLITLTSTDGRKSSVKIVQIVTEQSKSLISARFFLDGTLDLLLFGAVSGGL